MTRSLAIALSCGMALASTGCASTLGSAPPRATSTRHQRARRAVVVLPLDVAAPRREVPARIRVVRAGPVATEVAASAAPALERARTAFRDLAFDEALAAVGEAQLVLEAHAHTASDFDALTQALLYRGMAELALGRAERARDALRTVVILRPTLTLDEARFAPEVRALHEEMAAAVRADPPSALTVTTEPADASISVDGQPVGRAPRTVQGSSGRHYVEVSALGHETRVLSVVLAPGGSPALHVALPLADPAAVATALATAGHDARAIGPSERGSLRAALDTDLLAVVSRCGGLCAHAADLRTGRSRELRAASLDALFEQIATADDADDVPRRRTHSTDDDGGSWLASPWPWIVLGAVAIGAGVTTAVVVTSGDPTTRIVITPQGP